MFLPLQVHDEESQHKVRQRMVLIPIFLIIIFLFRLRRRPGGDRNVGWQCPEPHAGRQRNCQSC